MIKGVLGIVFVATLRICREVNMNGRLSNGYSNRASQAAVLSVKSRFGRRIAKKLTNRALVRPVRFRGL